MNKTVDTIKKEKEEVSLKRTGKKEETITEEDDPNRIYTGFGVFSHIPLLKGGLDYFRKNNRYNDWDSKNPKETLIISWHTNCFTSVNTNIPKTRRTK